MFSKGPGREVRRRGSPGISSGSLLGDRLSTFTSGHVDAFVHLGETLPAAALEPTALVARGRAHRGPKAWTRQGLLPQAHQSWLRNEFKNEMKSNQS